MAARILEIDSARLPPERSLVSLGLDSLSAAELAAALESELGVQVPLATLLEGISLAELAEEVERRLMAPPPVAAPPPAAPGAGTAGPGRGRGPLSPGQRALWLLDQMAPGNPAYIIAGAGRVRGRLDRRRLKRAVAAVVARHGALRTTFDAGDARSGEAVQSMQVEARFDFTFEDATTWSEARLAERLSEEAYRPFDLAGGPLLRIGLWRRRERGQGGRKGSDGRVEHLLMLAVHHIAVDFWSAEVLLAELGALYGGRSLPPLAVSYGDFVRRQAERLAGPEGERLEAYWRAALPPGAPPLELPTDRPRPAVPSLRGGARTLGLGGALTAALHALGRQAGATPFMTLLAAFQVLLHRYSGQEEVRVGTPTSGRSSLDLASLVGYFVNPVVMRGNLAGSPSFAALLDRVRETALGAFAHQDYPFPLLAERLGGERDPSRPPVFQAMLVLYRERPPGAGRGAPGTAEAIGAGGSSGGIDSPGVRGGIGAMALGVAGSRVELGGLAVEPVPLTRRGAQVDLALLAAEIEGALTASLQFSSDLFDGVTAGRMLAQLRTLAAAAAADPARSIRELPLLGDSERQQLLEWNDTAGNLRPEAAVGAGPGLAFGPDEPCLHQLFERQARRVPGAVAAIADGDGDGDSGESFTYAALNARANRLARRLREQGVGPESVVAICAERSLAMVAGLLAILKAGGAYLPLDPDYPADRLRFMLDDSGARVLLAQRRLLARLGTPAAGTVTMALDDLDDLDEAPAEGGERRRRPRRPEAPEPDSTGVESGAGPENLAYVIYTSGSTGRPKGTMNTHRGIVNRLLWMQERYRLAADDRVLQKTPISFDVSVWELFWPLIAGASLVLARPGGHRDGAYLLDILDRQRITTVHFVPAMLRAFLAEAGRDALPPARRRMPGMPGLPRLPRLPRLRRVMASGEALPLELQQAYFARFAAPLHNLYGPTEAAVDVTHWECDADGQRVVPIGRPVANTSIRLLDRDGQEVPIGVAGELHIGGVQLARGYLGRAALTAQRFVPDPGSGGGGATAPGAPPGAPGSRLYRTGDLARHLPDGAIDFLGRRDDQVKIRGVRVELGEIEAVLAAHPAVAAAAVGLRPVARPAGGAGAEAPGEQRLVAWVVARGGPAAVPGAGGGLAAAPAIAELRRALAAKLPDAMVPAAFVFLERLPLTPSGKLDRRALPSPAERVDRPAAAAGSEAEGWVAGAAPVPPRTPAEELLAGLWSEILGVETIGAEDDFFALGGHSLLATRLSLRVRELFGAELPMRRVFERPTLAALAREIAVITAGTAGSAGTAGTTGSGAAPAGAAAEPIPRRPDGEERVLSYPQERLWFLDQLEPGSAAYNLPGALRLTGRLDPEALGRSLGEIVRRHEVLRSAYPAAADWPVPVVWPHRAGELPMVDLSALGEAAAGIGHELGGRLGRQPFDLARGPLVRAALVRLAPDRHLLILVLHHIVADGWSVKVLLRELAALYTAFAGERRRLGAPAAPLPELPLQYFDFARWQRRRLTGELLGAQLAYWRQALAAAPSHLALPADRPRPAAPSPRGARISQQLSLADTAELRRAARQSGATLFMSLLAAFAVLLHRATGEPDLVVGTPIANRERLELEGLIGCFVNTLALRADLSGRPSFRDLLGRVRQVCLAAYAHQDLPFEQLVETLAPRRDLASTPLFQVMLALQSAAGGGRHETAAQLAMELCDLEITAAKFDLTLDASETPRGLTLTFEYRRDLFDAATVRRLARQLRELLAATAAEPGREIAALPLLGAAERQQLLEWNDTAAAWGGDVCLHELFEEQARRIPEAVAVAAPTAVESLTYGALDARADRLARHLRELGARPETVVAICAERSLALVVGLVAILKAGAAYLPLDPDYPGERLRFMLRDAAAPVVLAQRALLPRLGGPVTGAATVWLDDFVPGRARGGVHPDRLASRVLPGNLAYVIYTSGSTGQPKGTMNTHRGIVNRLRWGQERYRLAADDRVLQKTPFSFDVSVWELFWPLTAGSCLVMARPGGHRDSAYLAETLAAQAITTVHFVPAMLGAFLEGAGLCPVEDGEGGVGSAGPPPARLPGLRRVLSSGEALGSELRQQFHAALAVPLHNLYGPTEAAVEVTSWSCEQPGAAGGVIAPPAPPPARAAAEAAVRPPGVPIGRPVANTRIQLLDREGRQVPIGVAGELCIGGVQLARGYLGRPELTAERFVPDPFGAPAPGDPPWGGGGAAAPGAPPGGARLYRTGDLARYLPDGAIDCLGRLDQQVKIRGVRVELGEIEAALLAHPAVQAAAVVLRPVARPDGGQCGPAAAAPTEHRLVAYLVARRGPGPAAAGAPAAGAAPTAADLRQSLAERLPDAMVPAAYVFVERLPLTPSGKVDRKALSGPALPPALAGAAAAPDAERHVGDMGDMGMAGAGRGALRTPAEELLAGLWAEVLGVEAIRPNDSFFALGGHSLLATRLISRVRRAFGVELPMRRVFEHPTLSALAAEISAVIGMGGTVGTGGAGGAGAGAEIAGPADGLEPLGPNPAAPGVLAGGQADAALSFSQERLWFLDQLTPGSAAYNLPGGVRLRGRLDVPALARSLNEIVRRHQVLRSVYPAAGGRPVQVVLPRLAVQLPVVDLSALAGGAGAAAIALGARLGRQPFDLAAGPLLRATLLRLRVPGGGEDPSPAAAEHLLVLALHHIVGDGWSVTVFLRELAAFYAAFAAGEPPALAELPIQYSDFVRWQRAWLAGEALAAQIAYWQQALAEAPAQLALPADRPRPPVQSFRGAAISRRVPPELAAALRRTARQADATLFMTLLAVLNVLLHRVTGQDDLVVGAPIANRERLEIEGLIGCFVNTLALRSDLARLAPSPGGRRPGFPELLAAVRQVSLGAYAHQELPFEKLVETLAPRRDLAATPLFQVALALQNATTATSVEVPAGAAGPPGAHRDSLAMELCELPIETAKFDLLVQAAETPAGLALSFEYSRDLFDAATVRRLAEQYGRLLAAVAAGAASPPRSIDELPLLGAGERHQLLAEWSGAAAAYPRESLVHELFAAQALRRPDAVAVAAGAEQLTYGEIHRRSNQLARRLRRLGVGPEALVALGLPRSPAMVVALLGTLKSGGAYLPLDPGLPWPRQEALLAETGARVLLTAPDRARPASGRLGGDLVSLPLGGGRELDGESAADLDPPEVGASPESLAYVMFTSGSSGAPKGVAAVHRGVVRLVREAGFADCGPGQVWLHVAPLAFDASTLEIWGPLLGGGRLELFAPGPPDLRELGEALRRGGVTTLWLTAGLFHQMVESRVESLGCLRQLLTGGDVLSAPHVRRALQELPGCLLINAYGPTENTTFTSCHRMMGMTAVSEAGAAPPSKTGAAPPSVPIGRPIANSTVYLWDRQGQAVPVGVPGELVTGGDGLARGYLGRPDLTAERFVPDPFADGRGAAGGRLYRTGDLARWLPSGDLEFLGRIDRQVKIRGFRIEPGEVEAHLARHPGVEQSVVAARQAGPGDRRLAAWVVARPGSQVTSAGLRGFLAERLADHSVPAAVVLLAALPLTANGKVDRDALPEPEWLPAPRHAELAAGQLAARTPVEELLAGFWAELLGPRRPSAAAGGGGAAIGPGDDFFALGGHSLLATRLVSRVREELGAELPLRRVFERPTLAAMAREVEGALGGSAGLARPTLSPIPRRLPPVRLPESHHDLVLSYAQERIWFLAQLAPDSAAYNVAGALRLSGALSPARLARSLEEIVRRHAVLRSAYPLAAGRPSPLVLPARAVELPLIDLAPLGEAAAATGRAFGSRFGRRPFDLATGPLLRAALLRLGPERHLLVLVLHHIVADGWSVTVFLRELAALYAALPAARRAPPGLLDAPGPLPELPIQYFDFARWQRESLTGEALAPQLGYWRQALAGAPSQLALPADRPRPPVPDFAGACVRELVPSAVTAGLRREAMEGGATLFMVLLAAFDVLLCRYTGQQDLVVGTPIANRDRLDIEGLIGCFVNTLALRADLAGRPSFHGLLQQVRQTCLAAYANQDLPFEKLVEALAPQRDLGTTPLFQVMLVLQSATTAARQRPTAGLEIELGELDATAAKFELTIDALERPQGLALSFEYRTGLFDAATIKRLAGHFQSLLAAVGAGTHRGLDVAALPLLGEGERQQLLWEWNDTAAAHPGDRFLHQLFEEQARRAPDAVAVVAEAAPPPDAAGATVEHLTHGALEARANRLAADLRRLGVGPESLVAICAERSAAMVAGLLAILKAGAAYLPLDPGYPAERLRFMLRDSGARVLVASPNLPGCRGPAPGRRSLPWLGEAAAGVLRHGCEGRRVTTVWLDPEPAGRRPGRGRSVGSSGLQPDNLAYVIYTSGSTGQPKGAMNTHRGIVNRLLWMQERHPLAAADRVLQKTPLSFDVSVWELFWPLSTGACLVMARPEGHRDFAYLLAALARHEITTVHFVPAMLSAFLDGADRAGRPSRLPSLRRVMASGEALSYELQQQYYAALDAPLHNLYGPTEAAVEVTSWATERAGARRLVPIGRPVANTRLRLLDREGRQLPAGVPGELCIGGVQLARGYLGRPELTADRFVPDPENGGGGAVAPGAPPGGGGGAIAPGAPPGGGGGARLYRTGDLARYLPDGALDYLGRLDHQVKIRGVRIEPGEIEAALARHPGVREAVVAVVGPGPAGPVSPAAAPGPRLVAYLVPRQPSPAADPAGGCLPPEEEAALIDDVRRSLRRSLPEAMVPAAIVVLAALPLSANGKVDRRALPAPRWGGGPGAVEGRVAPRTPDEEILAGLFASLLGLDVARGDGRGEVGVHESFFDLGGHSLLVTRLLARVREVFQVELPLRRVFECASVAALAAAIAVARQGGLPAAAIPRVPPPPLPPEARRRPLPLSFAQERLWFLDQLEPGSPAYNMPFALRLTGALRVGALAAGLGEVRRRHEVLRTRIVAGGSGGGGARPVAVVEAAANPAAPAAPAEDGELRRIDLASLPASRRAAEAVRLRAEEARRPFDLAAGPLLRTVLLRLDGGVENPAGPAAVHELLLTLHHIAGDGWSIEVLARELAALYAAGVSGLPPAPGALPELPIQYADFAHWQRERLAGERLAAELGFWREQLAGPRGAPPPLELPGDRPAAAAASLRGARRGFALSAAVAGELTALARRHGATLFMALLAAFDVLLGRHGGQEDVAVGVPVANRDRPEVQNLVGLFVNTLVLRLDLAGDPGFLELLGRARQAALAAYAHQEVPFEQLVAELKPRREAGETPFFQALLALQPELAPPSMPGLAVELLDSDSGTAKFELSLAVAAAAGGGLSGSWTYRAGRFEAATIERLSGQLRELLRAVAAAPQRRLSELPLLGEAERHQLLVEWNGGWEPGGDDLVHAPFEREAARHPDAVALAARGADGRGGLALTYGELAAQAGRLASLLAGLGVGPEQVVGICVEPSFDLLVGLLGILKAGGAYLPLDPSHPRDRQAQILADSAARVVLADGPAVERLQGLGGRVLLASPAWVAVAAPGPGSAGSAGSESGPGSAERGLPSPPPPPPLPPRPDNAAYVLYTSGSTGAPKGVVAVHRAVVNRLRFQVAADLAPGARVLQRARLAFDVSVVELFAPLWMGGTVVLAEAARQQEAGYLARLIEMEQVTNANAPPALLPALLAEEALLRCRSLRRVVTGGERVPADLLALFDSAMARSDEQRVPRQATGGAAADQQGVPRQATGGAAAGALLVSRYGPTEATVSVTEWSGLAAACTGPTVPLGWPIAGARFYVLGRDHRELPPGAPGELCIAGLCLARGYLARPDLTAAAFVPDPFAGIENGGGGAARAAPGAPPGGGGGAAQAVPGAPPGAGGRLYRTGDLARRRADGVIEFLGRIDRQVKIRGFRLELGEVEAVLARHPEVGEVAVVDRDEPATGGKRLVAYVVRRAAPGPAAAPLDPRQLRAFVAAQLPPYMVPAAYVTLERLPLTPNGKLDRRALPAPEESAVLGAVGGMGGMGSIGARRGPRTPAERLLAGFWTELLGVRQVGEDDDFFELGGHSLLATQLVSRVRGELGVELPLRRVFERPTLSGLAQELSTLLAGADAMPPILAVPRDRELPLSFAQERLWFLEQLRPGTPTYNIASALRLRGALDRAALAAALAGVVRRHETLRTTFAVRGGRPVVRIAPEADGALPLVDLSRLPMARRARAATGLADQDAATPFDLAARPPVRACLLWLGRGATPAGAPDPAPEAAEHWLLLAVHHIAADGWSVGVLLGELTELYGAALARRPARLPRLAVQYADFACWQRDWLRGDVLRRQLGYWRERLRGAPPLTSPPADRPRPALQRWAGEVRPVRFDPALAGELRAAARAQKVTLFMLLAAALDLVLLRQIGRPDLVLGTPIAGRTRNEVEGLIGLFLNSLALRVRPVAEEGLPGLLGQVREVTLGAYAHQELPFEQLVEDLSPERSLSQSPLFQVMLVLQNAPWRELRLPGVEAAAVAIDNRSAKVDLTLSLHEAASGLSGVCRYNRDLFDGGTVGRLMQQMETLLRAALADPERPLAALPLLSRAERQQLLDWNDTAVRWGEAGCLHQLLAAQARRSPEAPAVGFAGEWLSYGELDARANGLAHRLRAAGVGPEVLVGLCVERSAEMMVGVLAVLKAGGAYLPLDPSYPRERVAFMLEEAAVPVLLTQQRLASGLGAPAATVICLDAPGGAAPPAAAGPEVPVDPDNLAYVVYTSGSTGRPKGAMNTHRAIVNRLLWMQSAFGLEASDRVVQKTPLSFDVSVWELFWPLLCGAGLVVARPGGHQDTDYLLDLIARERVTTVHFVPSMLRALLDAPDLSGAAGLRRVVASGEALPAELLARYRERLAVPLYNLYGPTEAAVDVTAWECLPAARRRAAGASDPGRGLGGVPIGRPIANTTIRLLDAALRPVPVGVPGELYIGGVQPARGYLRRPGLTAERFVPDPESAPGAHESGGGGASAPGAPPWGGGASAPGAPPWGGGASAPGAPPWGGGAPAPGAPPWGGGRLYRTGDLARYLPDGAIEFLGRIDHQVKIRGFRIEPGEIEARLARHPAVAAAAVVARGSGAAAQLVAYVVPRPGSSVARGELRRWLAASLPEHMLPSAWVELAALPLTPSGKIDRRALPEPAASGAAQGEPVLPRTPLERYLADLWRDALPAGSFGIEDNFFALGGNSLSGAMLIYRLQEKLGEIVHVVTLFDAPTIAGLAAHLVAEHPRAVARLWGGEGGDGAAAAGEPEAAGRVGRAQVARMRQLLGARAMPPAAAPAVAGERNPPAVFVLSPPRSGSTLLRVMLAGHSRLFAPPELELLSYRTLSERRRALSGRDAFRREGAVRALMEIRGCAATEALGLIAGCEDAGFSTRRFYGLLQQDLGERLLVDKTPTYAWDRQALRRAEEDFAGPLYVHLVRHPCATIRSFEEAKLDQIFFGAGHPFTRRELAELSWTVAHQNILELRGEVPPERWHTVSFEQLVREPGRVLAAVCAFLGLAYEPAMARPYESRPGRMVDGIHAQSRMLGDVKFHSHRQVDAGVGERSWGPAAEAALGEPTRETASALGIALARREASAPLPANLVGLQPGDGRRPPLVLIHPVFGDVQIYRHLARELGPDQPVYGFQTPALTGGTVPERLEGMAAQYLAALLAWRPAGPYLLAGSSMGGCIAFEMARQLTALGHEVALLALLDSWAGEPLARAASAAVPKADGVEPQAAFLAWLTGGDERILGRELAGLDGESRLALVLERARRAGGLPASSGSADLLRLLAAIDGQRRALHLYEPGPYSGRVLFLRAAEGLAGHPEATWRKLARGGLELHRVPGGHRSMFLPPHVATAGRLLTAAIRAVTAVRAGEASVAQPAVNEGGFLR